ncbi:MAG: MarR family transcriptional regulator [Chloroflexota bacterium]
MTAEALDAPATAPTQTSSTCAAEIALDDPRLRAWRAFLFAQAAVLRELETELMADEQISLAEYDALTQLAAPEDRRLRMSELAERLVISRSGVTRLVDRLEAQGLVVRSQCAPDGRGAYAVLTTAGLARLRAAVPTHLRHVDEHFLSLVTPEQLAVIEQAMTTVAQATGRCVAQLTSGLSGRLDDDAALAGSSAPAPDLGASAVQGS